MTRLVRISRSEVERIEAEANRQLTPEEFRAWADGPIPEAELTEKRELIRWFRKRYPTPAARLRWARRHQEQLARTIAHVRKTSGVE
jgi:hypothetical protein